MRPPLTQPFEQVVRVEAADIDQLGHVNNTVYLRWVQDVATAHWRAAAAPEHQAALAWIVVRHEIDYAQPAGPDDEVILRTWVGTSTGLRFERHTEVLRHPDRKLLARARTLWCPIDPQTLRPRRVPPDVAVQFSTGRGD